MRISANNDYATRRVSAAKTTECCFGKRCSTKQGATRAADLRRQSVPAYHLWYIAKRATRVANYATRRVSAVKTTECCFCKRCSTKQGVTRAADLRRRCVATMRLEGNSNLFEPRIAKIKSLGFNRGLFLLERITG